MDYFWCAIIGYLVGTLNPSYLIAKIKGFDIRSKGSGNAGASNAIINFGKKIGIPCAIFDILKASLAVVILKMLFPKKHTFAITGAGCIIGHIMPFYMGFKGGKGLACLGGIIAAFDIRVFLIMLAIEIVLVLITDYICFVPMSAAVVFPIVYGFMTDNWIGALILSIASVLILLKHIENIKRIKIGLEMHFSYLWNKDRERERLERVVKDYKKQQG